MVLYNQLNCFINTDQNHHWYRVDNILATANILKHLKEGPYWLQWLIHYWCARAQECKHSHNISMRFSSRTGKRHSSLLSFKKHTFKKTRTRDHPIRNSWRLVNDFDAGAHLVVHVCVDHAISQLLHVSNHRDLLLHWHTFTKLKMRQLKWDVRDSAWWCMLWLVRQ